MHYYSNPLNIFFCEPKKETNKFFPVKICALTTISKDVIYLSHSNSIKKLLNIKEKNFKITKVCDEDIKGITTKYNKFKKYWKLLLKNATKLSDKKYLKNKMFNYKYMSEEDIVKLLLSSNSHFEDSYDLYQDILININKYR